MSKSVTKQIFKSESRNEQKYLKYKLGMRVTTRFIISFNVFIKLLRRQPFHTAFKVTLLQTFKELKMNFMNNKRRITKYYLLAIVGGMEVCNRIQVIRR